jgi:trk system potassium uptake protein TrkA
MHIVILGCGRVGAVLADSLDADGHSVAIIDQDASAFRRLGSRFCGVTITGVGFDRDVLEAAGIERAHAFAAVSSGDNTNIISARTARETYGVDNVVARIYDPRRAEVYERLGIPTVATVSWTASAILRKLAPSGGSVAFTDSTGTISVVEIAYHPDWIGETVTTVESAITARVAFITRNGRAWEIDSQIVVQDGDLIHVITPTARRLDIESLLASPPQQAGTP